MRVIALGNSFFSFKTCTQFNGTVIFPLGHHYLCELSPFLNRLNHEMRRAVSNEKSNWNKTIYFIAIIIIAWINLGLKTLSMNAMNGVQNLDTLLTGSYSFRVLLQIWSLVYLVYKGPKREETVTVIRDILRCGKLFAKRLKKVQNI